jgi:hypothetical protein
MPIQLLDDINRTISMHTLLWNSVAAIPKVIRLWQRMCASEVNPDRIVHSSAEWVRDLSVMMVHFGADTPAHRIAGEQLAAVEKITGLTPVLKVWSSPVLMEWHWKQIEEVIGQELIDPSVITLGQIESWGLEKFQEELHSIEVGLYDANFLPAYSAFDHTRIPNKQCNHYPDFLDALLP